VHGSSPHARAAPGNEHVICVGNSPNSTSTISQKMLDFRLVAALLAISVGIAAARWASADDDCGASGWPVPSPPAGATLLQVLAIIR